MDVIKYAVYDYNCISNEDYCIDNVKTMIYAMNPITAINMGEEILGKSNLDAVPHRVIHL